MSSVYEVKDYNDLTKAVETTKTYTTKVTEVQDAATESKTIISDTSVFMGPIQENCVQEFATLDTTFQEMQTNFTKISSYLTTSNENYQAGDQKAEETVLDSTDKAKQTQTTGDTSKSGVVSYQVGKLSQPGQEAKVLGKRATLLDVTVDGNSLGQDGSIVIKKGQTVHLKVKVPDEIENVQTIKRTSADGGGGWQNIVSQKNTPNVDRNDPSTFVNQREYDWYITGNKTTNNVTLSQTVLFSIPGAKLGSYKGMVRVRVKVED